MARLDWSAPVRSLLFRLQHDGFSLHSVHDGEELTIILSGGIRAAVREAADIITSVDRSNLSLSKNGERVATLMIILGNEPEELVADWVAASKFEDAIDEAIDKFSSLWEGKRCPVIQ